MEILNIKRDELEKLKVIEEGSEGRIYLHQNHIIKLYGHPEGYNINKIKYFCNVQENMQGTKLPHGVVIIDDIFSGCLQRYFKDYQELNMLNANISIEYVIYFLKLFLKNIDELIQNKIYPVDLFYGNVLFSVVKQDVQIIDLDGYGSVIKKQHNQKILRKVLNQYLSTIFEVLFYEYINEKWYINHKSIIKRYPFKKEYADIIINDTLSIEFLYEFLEYFQKDEKDIFKNSNKLLKLKH